MPSPTPDSLRGQASTPKHRSVFARTRVRIKIWLTKIALFHNIIYLQKCPHADISANTPQILPVPLPPIIGHI